MVPVLAALPLADQERFSEPPSTSGIFVWMDPTENPERGEVTRILQRAGREARLSEEDGRALLELLYTELRRLAAAFMSGERASHTLQPTALVNEAWMRLADQDRVQWQGRAHYLAIAAQAMRRVLVDHARARGRVKRGGGLEPVELNTELFHPGGEDDVDLLALDEALKELRELSERQARVVELRFFGGLSMEETARVLDTSLRTAEREWRFARAWLLHRLGSDEA